VSFKDAGQMKLKVLRDLSAIPMEHLAAYLSRGSLSCLYCKWPCLLLSPEKH